MSIEHSITDPLFGIANLPYGVFSPPGGQRRVGVCIGDDVIDLAHALDDAVFAKPSLNSFMAQGRPRWIAVRRSITEHHATNLGRLFRPDAEPLLPNWKHLPVGYHGRAGTVVVSGTPIVRPSGQRRPAGRDIPDFGPSVRLDIEARSATWLERDRL